jgi:hypothetical protein
LDLSSFAVKTGTRNFRENYMANLNMPVKRKFSVFGTRSLRLCGAKQHAKKRVNSTLEEQILMGGSCFLLPAARPAAQGKYSREPLTFLNTTEN